MAVLHVFVTGKDRRHLSELRNKFRVVVVGARETHRGIVVDAYIPSERVDWLRNKGYGVKLLEEIDAPARARQVEGRAAAENRLKRGRYGDVIWGGGYLTVDEVEAAIVLGEENHSEVFERIRLPHLTWEKRRCHAFRIGIGDSKKRLAVCFLAGLHGREWGGPDILIYLGMILLRAYRDGKSIRLGGVSASTSTETFRFCGALIGISLLIPSVVPSSRAITRVTWVRARHPNPRRGM